ncbi:unnamed protein product [Parajaminaea phylloscopi]
MTAMSAPTNYPLEVTVSPQQSSFFAGEDVRCLITFKNLREPIPQSQPLPSSSRFEPIWTSDAPHRSVSHQHVPHIKHQRSQTLDWRKGDEESASCRARLGSADQSRSLDAGYNADGRRVDLGRNGESLPLRRHLIGQSARASPASISGKHQKSFSVASLPVSSLSAGARGSIGKGRPSNHGDPASEAAVDPRVPSGSVNFKGESASTPTRSRKASSTIHASHPHSRKQSVIQLQQEDLGAAFEISDTGVDDSEPARNVMYAHSANASTLSIASAAHGVGGRSFSADPLGGGVGSPSGDLTPDADTATEQFYGTGRNDTMESVVRDQFTQWSRGAPHPRSTTAVPGAGARGTHPSPLFPQHAGPKQGTEVVYWSFAQFSGSYEIDESMIKPGEFEEVKRKLAFGDGLANTAPQGTMRTLGGGDLGHLDEVTPDSDRTGQAGWGSYLRNVLSGSASGSGSGQRSHRRTSSTMLDTSQRMMTSRTIPLFSSPPSIVAVDLSLTPGQSRSYSFTLQLPPDLPPSYYGKAVRFKYELVVGTNRMDASRTAAHFGHQRSRLIKIPLRVYNHVGISEARPFFDLTNPVILLKDEAIVREEDVTSEHVEPHRAAEKTAVQVQSTPWPALEESDHGGNARTNAADLRSLQAYTRSLLSSCQSDAGDDPDLEDAPTDFENAVKRLSVQQAAAESGGHLSKLDPIAGRGNLVVHGPSSLDEDIPQSCKGAIEVVFRNSQKVSYDISKDGQVAAVLTLVKSKYRLGDTVLGVVNINRPNVSARVIRVAAVLESHEEIEPSLSTLPASRVHKLTRKVHTECHECTLFAGQSSFSLPIPSGATPDFLTSGVKLRWTVRMSFLLAMPAQSQAENDPPASLLRPTHDGYSLWHSSYRAIECLSGPQSTAPTPTRTQNATTGTKLEIVECAVPLVVLPNSTRFRAQPVSFAA